MTNICQICERPLEERALVQFVGRGVYHRLKSKVSYAIDKDGLDINPQSLVHVDCLDSDVPFFHELIN